MPEITHLTTDIEDEVFCIPMKRWGSRYDAGDTGPDYDVCSECGAVLEPDVLAKQL